MLNKDEKYAEFKKLSKYFRKRGVSFLVNNWICEFHFNSFTRFGNSKAGSGKKALKIVCMKADRLQVELVLFTHAAKLEEYYKSFGFEVDKTLSDIRGVTYMKRKPVISVTTLQSLLVLKELKKEAKPPVPFHITHSH